MKSAKKQQNWYKHRGYLHFDYARREDSLAAYVTDPVKVASHAFSPLIHYVKKSRRYHRDKKSNSLVIEVKPRKICYASHIDSCVYAYYNQELGKKYESFLQENDLEDLVLAYRKIEKRGTKFCNIHMANEAFSYVKSTGGCNVICLDISSFFDSLCPIVLKQTWCKVLGAERLPPDHFNVYDSLVRFTYVHEKDCQGQFGLNPRQHKKGKEYNFRNRLCSYTDLRAAHKAHAIIKNKRDLKISGIPQGTPISGLLANIFMIHFDMRMKEYALKTGGFYRRYSDDIFFAFPEDLAFSRINDDIQSILKDTTQDALKINSKKTEERTYIPEVRADRIQYLGFIFDGKETFIRNSSMSKNRSQIAETVRKHKKGNKKINTRAVYKAQSVLVMSPYDLKRNGFIRYAARSVEVMDGEGIANQIAKNDTYIKNKIRAERDIKRRPR